MSLRTRWIDRLVHGRVLTGLLALGLAALLVACSTPAPSERTAATADMSAGVAASRIAPAPAAPAPALGTQWGEDRESRVRTVDARRLNADRPDDQRTIAYNDAAGVRAQVGRNPQRQLNVLLAQGDIEWSVRDENDRPLALQQAGPQGGLHVAGTQGGRYVLVFRNRSQRVYEVVATVDGLDVMNGQPGSLRHSGYVLMPDGLLRIEGFRKSQTEVAAFRFSAPGRAYAANTEAGDPRNIGVIGAAVFELSLPGRPPVPRRDGGNSRPSAFPADGAYAPPPRYPANR